VRNVLNLLRACFQDAVERHIILANPAAGVHPPKRRADLRRAATEPWTWLDPDEQACLIECCPEPLGWLVQWAIWTGMRESEQWQLPRADVHDDSPHPHVVIRFGSNDEGPTKTRRIRYMPLLPGAVEAWQHWCEAARERIAETGLAFPTIRRRGTARSGMPTWYRRAVVASGVHGVTGHPVNWHSLRHTCASMLVSGGWGRSWSLEEVRELLGHKDIRTTQRYAHLARRAVDRAAEETRAAMARESAAVLEMARREPAGSTGDGSKTP